VTIVVAVLVLALVAGIVEDVVVVIATGNWMTIWVDWGVTWRRREVRRWDRQSLRGGGDYLGC
jgi:hypothetical protein